MESITTSLTIGLLTTTSYCVLPLYPGFLAYISGGQDGLHGKSSRYFLGFFVLAGVLTMMLALGGVIALLYSARSQIAVLSRLFLPQSIHERSSPRGMKM